METKPETLEQEVNHPSHYRSHESGIEAITITRYLMCDLANAWKYAMRYEDKGTPKKDLLKLVWYLEDWARFFLDENNVDVCQTTVDPVLLYPKMLKVIDAEPVPEIAEVMRQIYRIVLDGGLVSPSAFKKALDDVKAYAEKFDK
jgi:hypothetical protein